MDDTLFPKFSKPEHVPSSWLAAADDSQRRSLAGLAVSLAAKCHKKFGYNEKSIGKRRPLMGEILFDPPTRWNEHKRSRLGWIRSRAQPLGCDISKAKAHFS
jgi:hypothetical protein